MSRNITQPTPLFDTLKNLKETARCFTIPEPYQQEFDLSLAFLWSYRGSEASFNSYRREIERLIQWSWRIKKASLKELKRADIEDYLEFCQSPPKHWVNNKNVRRFLLIEGKMTPNPEWRPFTQTLKHNNSDYSQKHNLSNKAIQAIFAIMSSFFNYLIQEDFIAYNPVQQIRQKNRFLRKNQQNTVVRRLSSLQWSYTLETAERLADKNPEHERTLLIMHALYSMYLRISELVHTERWQPQMGDFFQDNDNNWWFKTVGKGNKERTISVSNGMLHALFRYRKFLGLSSYPARAETTPLITQLKTSRPITSTRQIRNIVEHCFQQTAHQLIKDGFTDEADALQSATVHWLRHTGISDDVKRRPREHVRDDAGHGSSSITDRYIDVELRERHASAKHKPIDPLNDKT